MESNMARIIWRARWRMKPTRTRMDLAMDRPIRCLAVDDHSSVRQGLALLFGGLDDLELRGTGETGEDAIEAIENHQPEVVIMDVRLPGIDGISAVKRIQQAAPSVQTVIFSAYGDKRLLSDALA